jgi:phosphoribosylformimino-5-aminoimidazole carboxamide ribotide isomerase
MRLFPAIDIQGGRCVRLRRGDFDAETVFGDDPVQVARGWARQGARYLHVVDLDGAKQGNPVNLDIVRAIAEGVDIPVQFGGGIRSRETLGLVAKSRVSRVVIGTSALLDEDFLQKALADWGDRLVVAVDADEGYVKTHGWREKSGMAASSFARQLEVLGVCEIIYTDISRDGMMQGVNLPGIRALAEETKLQIIASGGVTELEDLRALKKLEPLGVTGVIAGRALYEGRFSLTEALEVLDQCT